MAPLSYDAAAFDPALCEDHTGSRNSGQKCSLHGATLVKGVTGCRIKQAPFGGTPEDIEAGRLFPEANDFCDANCVPGAVPCVRNWFCIQCRKEKEAWLRSRHGTSRR
jgi:hypothetical protein